MSKSLRLITLSGLDQAQNAKVKSLHSELVPFLNIS